MAIDPTGRFPQLPVPFIQQRPTSVAPASAANGASESSTIQNRGRPAQAELQADIPEDNPQRRQAGAQRQPQTGQSLAAFDPNAPRGSIIDIEV
ncbi:MAG: hypothetical protein O3B74_12835 [Proteobacteria bacterium]|nr:hypothetical protein [Pseudomonadota bacterium]